MFEFSAHKSFPCQRLMIIFQQRSLGNDYWLLNYWWRYVILNLFCTVFPDSFPKRAKESNLRNENFNKISNFELQEKLWYDSPFFRGLSCDYIIGSFRKSALRKSLNRTTTKQRMVLVPMKSQFYIVTMFNNTDNLKRY